MVAKLTMRPNDTGKGRANKLAHYIDLHKRLIGGVPPDLHLFVRNRADIPLTEKNDVEAHLKNHAWEEQPIPDPTLLARMVHRKGG